MPADESPDRVRQSRRRYSEELRRELVAQVIECGLSASLVAQRSGVPPSTLRRWVRQRRAESEQPEPRTAPVPEGADHPAPTAPPPATVPRPRSPVLPSALAATPQPVPADPRGDLRPHHGPDQLIPRLAKLPMPARMLVVILAWSASLLVAAVVTPPQSVVVGAAVAHLLSLAVGFGAVILIDWHGLLWLAGRRGLAESTRLAAAASPVIWAGWTGLLASGALLDPDLTILRTWVKLLLVLTIGLNGAAISTIATVVHVLPSSVSFRQVPTSLQARIAVSTAASQIGWWAAIVIGFMTARS